jgi:hypothetical protein
MAEELTCVTNASSRQQGEYRDLINSFGYGYPGLSFFKLLGTEIGKSQNNVDPPPLKLNVMEFSEK